MRSPDAGIRIAYLANFSPKKLGTGEDRLVALSAGARARGHSLTIFGHEPLHPGLRDAFERDGTTWRALRSIADHPLRSSRELARAFDVIQLNAIAPRSKVAYAAYAAFPTPVLFVDHISGPPGDPFPVRSPAHRAVDRLTVSRIRQIAGVSEYVRRRAELRFGLPPSRTCRMYGGVDVERFRPRVDRSDENEPGLRILTVAALIPDKGIDVLLQAVSSLADLVWTLDVVGDGPDRERLEALSRSLGVETRVRFLGLRDDVDDLLRETDVFVHPAVWQEALGYTILEGMASGCAVIATNVGGIPELIRPDEGEGVLVEPGQPADLAEQLRLLGSEPELRRTMGERARARIQDHFTLERNVTRTLDWFELVVGGKLLPIGER